MQEIVQAVARLGKGALREVSITGGEPFARNDLQQLIRALLLQNKSANIFINTNGFFYSKTQVFVRRFLDARERIFFCVSLEGRAQAHNAIRGAGTFDRANRTIDICVKHGFKGSISTTYSKNNLDCDDLSYLSDRAAQTGWMFTGRLVDDSDYYNSRKNPSALPKGPEMKRLLAHIEANHIQLPYFKILHRYLMTGRISDICPAGKTFAFLNNRLEARICPFINIGLEKNPRKKGYSEKPYSRRCRYCCTECRIYPTLFYAPASYRRALGETK